MPGPWKGKLSSFIGGKDAVVALPSSTGSMFSWWSHPDVQKNVNPGRTFVNPSTSMTAFGENTFSLPGKNHGQGTNTVAPVLVNYVELWTLPRPADATPECDP